MWRNFRCLHMTNVEKSGTLHIRHVCDEENVAIFAKFYSCRFVAKSINHAVLSRNLFCHNFCAFIWRKIEPKVYFLGKNDKYEVCSAGIKISILITIRLIRSKFGLIRPKFLQGNFLSPDMDALCGRVYLRNCRLCIYMF